MFFNPTVTFLHKRIKAPLHNRHWHGQIY